jgi:hypothetical protein
MSKRRQALDLESCPSVCLPTAETAESGSSIGSQRQHTQYFVLGRKLLNYYRLNAYVYDIISRYFHFIFIFLIPRYLRSLQWVLSVS